MFTHNPFTFFNNSVNALAEIDAVFHTEASNGLISTMVNSRSQPAPAYQTKPFLPALNQPDNDEYLQKAYPISPGFDEHMYYNSLNDNSSSSNPTYSSSANVYASSSSFSPLASSAPAMPVRAEICEPGYVIPAAAFPLPEPAKILKTKKNRKINTLPLKPQAIANENKFLRDVVGEISVIIEKNKNHITYLNEQLKMKDLYIESLEDQLKTAKTKQHSRKRKKPPVSSSDDDENQLVTFAKPLR